ncbi:sensor histidine kinase [Cohnella herbarum]|uniref:Histidine kinase n=1 Tax=Cohnella herbarum TaxID=2728023 RepID=A0A7Z2VP44_9BACL|nr:histidine kinase [Cohnella herbarum]QJD86400.1 histidine kinase [Cohnella herbarum]
MTSRRKEQQEGCAIKFSVYIKVIVVFTVLIIPVYAVNLWMNAMGMNFVRQKDEESSTYNLKFYASQLNDQLFFIRNLQKQLLTDSDLQKLAFRSGLLETYEEFRMASGISERLATIRNSSEYVVNAGIWVKSYNKSISTNQGIAKLPNEEWSTLEGLVGLTPRPLIHYENGRLFFLQFSNNASIVSYLELSIPKLQGTLNRLAPYPNSGVVLADGRFEGIVSDGYDPKIIAAIRDQAKDREGDPETDSWVLRSGGDQYRIGLNPVPSMGWTIYTYVDENEITGTLKKYGVWFLVLSVVSGIVILAFAFSVNRMIHRPLHKLIRAFNMMEPDHVRVPSRWKEETEFDYLYRGFDNMVERLNRSIRENYEHQLALQNSELKQLQSQINPHFLYNGFYNIYRLCKIGEYDRVATLTQKLASYYQAITRSGKDEVPLDKEYRHAMNYCDIQAIRFSNRIRVSASDVPEPCKSFMVPRLIIQPLIENAFEHAFENAARPGRIRLTMTCEDRRFSLCVEDDGTGLSDETLAGLQAKLSLPDAEAEKTGLINVCRRLRLKYGEESGVFVSRSELGGLKAELIILWK